MSKIGEVREALEKTAEQRDDYASDAHTLWEMWRRAHDANHPGTFVWCDDTMCIALREAESELKYAY